MRVEDYQRIWGSKKGHYTNRAYFPTPVPTRTTNSSLKSFSSDSNRKSNYELMKEFKSALAAAQN